MLLESFHIELDALNLQMIGNAPKYLPEWINLEFLNVPTVLSEAMQIRIALWL